LATPEAAKLKGASGTEAVLGAEADDEADAGEKSPPAPKRSVVKPAKKSAPPAVAVRRSPGLEPFLRIFGPPRPNSDVITTTNSR
jgi:hypothetical protein